MANIANTSSRRSFLAAAALAPVVIAAPAIAAPAFDPATWIRKFLALGGTLSVRADGVFYAYAPENEEVTALVMDCYRIPGQWDAVRARANAAFA